MRISTFFPFLQDLRGYTRKNFRKDMLAALTVTPMAIPQAMAYALIAGVHPQYGIYTAIFPVVVAALWGSSRYLTAGPTNAVSMVLYSSLVPLSIGGVMFTALPEDQRMACIFIVAAMCGLMQMAMGLARLGELTNFISHSVMTAFVAGASLLIAAGQLKTVFGMSIPKAEGFFPQVYAAVTNLDRVNDWSVIIAISTIFLTLLYKRISRRFPATLAALVTVGLLAFLCDCQDKGVRMVGEIPSVIPPLSLPATLDLDLLRELLLPALAVALLGAVESLTIAKQMAGIRQDPFDASRELVAQGLGNLTAGFTSSLPGCGSFTRSALMFASGGSTRFGPVLAGLMSLPLLLLLSNFISWLPMPALGGVLLLACVGMINVDSIMLALKTTRTDRAAFIVTFASTLLLGLEHALFLGVLISLLFFIYNTAHPRVRMLTRRSPLIPRELRSWPEGLVVFSIEGALFFGAIAELERRLLKLEQRSLRLIVLHITRVFTIDASGAHALEQFLNRAHSRSVPVILVMGNREVRETLRRAGVLATFGDGFMANSMRGGLKLAASFFSCSGCWSETPESGRVSVVDTGPVRDEIIAAGCTPPAKEAKPVMAADPMPGRMTAAEIEAERAGTGGAG